MAAKHINRLKCGISNTPGSAGNFIVSSGASGFRTFTAADDGQTFDVTITEVTTWELRTGCVYTHSTTTLTRGTLADSSTGSAISFSSAAIVVEGPHAAWANSVLRLATLTGTKDGSNAAFTLSLLPVASVIVVLNGLCLSVAGGGFSFSGTAVTMSAGYIPASTDDLYAFVQ